MPASTPFQRVPELSAFFDEPARRYVVRRSFAYWQAERRVFGIILWGRPDEADVDEICAAHEVGADVRASAGTRRWSTCARSRRWTSSRSASCSRLFYDEDVARRIGRYDVFESIGSGGMASVHLGRMLAPRGFSRIVAIKRVHAQLVEDDKFVAMLLEEARLAVRIQHAAVVQTLDVVSEQDEVLLVMEYVHGESLATLLRTAVGLRQSVPAPIAATIALQMLRGLHAAHEITDESGRKLDLIHRDVSPPNVLVGAEGEVKLIDFGIAKVLGRAPTTAAGQVKGKIPYMSPERFGREPVDRRTDVFASGIVLWEMLVGARLFTGEEGDIVDSIRTSTVTPPSRRAKVSLDPELDTIVMKALQKRPDDRYLTAAAMAEALETRELASPTQVGAWVKYLCGDSLERRTARIAAIEREVLVDEAQASSRRPPPPTSVAPPSPVPSAPPPSRASEERRLAPSASRSRRGGLLALVAVALALAVGFGLYRMKRRSHRAVGVTMATAPTSPPTVAIPDISASPPPSAIASTAPPASALASPSASALAPRGASKGARPAPRAPR